MAYLPIDILAEIFSYPLTISTLFSIIHTSKFLRNIAIKNIKQVIDEEGEYNLKPPLIYLLTGIKNISSNHHIIIDNREDIRKLSQHPTLQRATFILSLPGYQANTIPQVAAFIKCYNKSNINLVFGTGVTPLSITLANSSLYLTNISHFHDLTITRLVPFFKTITSKFLITNYSGPFDVTIGNMLKHLPNLKALDLHFDTNIFLQPLIFLLPTLEEVKINIKGRKINITSNTRTLSRYYEELITYFANSIITTPINNYPKIKRFIPVPITYINTFIRDYFPNLEEIELTPYHIGVYAKQQDVVLSLDKYNKIIFHRFDLTAIGDTTIAEMFPKCLRHKLVIVKDW